MWSGNSELVIPPSEYFVDLAKTNSWIFRFFIFQCKANSQTVCSKNFDLRNQMTLELFSICFSDKIRIRKVGKYQRKYDLGIYPCISDLIFFTCFRRNFVREADNCRILQLNYCHNYVFLADVLCLIHNLWFISFAFS